MASKASVDDVSKKTTENGMMLTNWTFKIIRRIQRTILKTDLFCTLGRY